MTLSKGNEIIKSQKTQIGRYKAKTKTARKTKAKLIKFNGKNPTASAMIKVAFNKIPTTATQKYSLIMTLVYKVRKLESL